MATETKAQKRLLPCKLTDDEVAERAQELAKAEIYRGQVERDYGAEAEDWKTAKKMWESKVMTASEACIRLGKVVKNREEERDVECLATVSNAQFYLTRTDTGEVVIQRPATQEEMQMSIPELEAIAEAVAPQLMARLRSHEITIEHSKEGK